MAVDGLRRASLAVAGIGVLWMVAPAGGGLLSFGRSTRLDVRGVKIHRLISTSVLPWSTVSSFTLCPHRWGRRDRIAAVTADGDVLLEHADSKSLVQRPGLSRQWYLAVIDRLESVRRRYVV